jgi:hypothetical protein
MMILKFPIWAAISSKFLTLTPTIRILCPAMITLVFLRISLFQAQAAEQIHQHNQKTSPPENSFLSVYNESSAFPGFTVFPIKKSKVLLLNMLGEPVHEWTVPAVRARLLPNCNLLVVHDSPIHEDLVREYNWNMKIVWEYRSPHLVHHDVRRLRNGNTIFPYLKKMVYSIPPSAEEPHPAQRKLRSDVILEVSRTGDIVWEWHADRYLDRNRCRGINCKYHLESKHWIANIRDWTHVNTVQVLPDNKWHRQGDPRFKPGNIIILPRNMGTAMIIDRPSKKIVWEYAGDYRGGLVFPHESHMIPEGLPGAGNILIFDNGRKKKRGSFALEINPVTKKVVWVYENGPSFFSKGLGSLQRLPNGNTLISEDERGRVFEVTPDKQVVWRYKRQFAVKRAHRYPPDYCPRLAKLKLK